MRYCSFLLISFLSLCHSVQAAEFFGEFLYWKVTEPVDWVLNTNRLPANQYVNYETARYDFAPGFRVGGSLDGDWRPQISWTHFQTSTSDSVTGDLTAAFLGGKNAQPAAPQIYFDAGQMEASINYDVIDLDFGKAFDLGPGFQIRPVIGLRGGIIRQSFTTAFQANYTNGAVVSERNIVEKAESNFSGLGPKVGIENQYSLHHSENSELNLTAGFYAAYLVGRWNLPDVTHITQIDDGIATHSTQVIQVNSRDFASLTFQAIVGVNFRVGNWGGAVGYELNDWLNQGQFFTDASGPQNNDLLLQGLNARITLEF